MRGFPTGSLTDDVRRLSNNARVVIMNGGIPAVKTITSWVSESIVSTNNDVQCRQPTAANIYIQHIINCAHVHIIRLQVDSQSVIVCLKVRVTWVNSHNAHRRRVRISQVAGVFSGHRLHHVDKRVSVLISIDDHDIGVAVQALRRSRWKTRDLFGAVDNSIARRKLDNVRLRLHVKSDSKECGSCRGHWERGRRSW